MCSLSVRHNSFKTCFSVCFFKLDYINEHTTLDYPFKFVRHTELIRIFTKSLLLSLNILSIFRIILRSHCIVILKVISNMRSLSLYLSFISLNSVIEISLKSGSCSYLNNRSIVRRTHRVNRLSNLKVTNVLTLFTDNKLKGLTLDVATVTC